MEHFEAGIKLVEQGLASAIEMIGHVQRAGGQSAKYLEKKLRKIYDYYRTSYSSSLSLYYFITLSLFYSITISLYHSITLIYNLVSLFPHITLTLCSVSSMTIKTGLSSRAILRYSEFSAKPCCDVLKISDHEYPSARAGK